MALFNDLLELIVDNSNIQSTYSPRIYFQILPEGIDKDKKWLRWGFARGTPNSCMGGGVSWNNYNVFIDIITRNVNDLPSLGDTIIDDFHSTNYKGIKTMKFTGDTYTNYIEKGLYVRSLNFDIYYK